ncbi:uncharacterized protein (DUF1697 family) [Microbacterium ginsengiterrae]|uniref:Uncharacterized protein (DUF1697 family) n=1 Tax=Microbacterium ginsengiterrae TaxID=546115 RepID=A0A7W9CAG7_9MICO|nr:DUF1697 domain-containing protein [Microbacterium ginsengiterrae]MBB5742044.1 uncharacterized protein (DUF1697 family) [Microbacterium ginsengiterrae]
MSSAPSRRSALLLRAVNVSGRNRVPMARLREVLESETDLEDVSTYIASGNILCRSPRDHAAACARVRAVVAEEFGVDTSVIARTHDELVAGLASLPFPSGEEKLVHAMFLEAVPSKGALETLESRLVPGEALALVGRDLWIRYSSEGVHATKLTKAVLDRALGVPGTARNLRTTRRLADLTAS